MEDHLSVDSRDSAEKAEANCVKESYMSNPLRISYDLQPVKKLDGMFEDAAETGTRCALQQTKKERMQVFLRLRPTDSRYAGEDAQNTIQILADGLSIKTTQPLGRERPIRGQGNAAKKAKELFKQYSFSRVFDQSTSQTEFYEDAVKPLLNGIFDGENVLLFSYGMTNAGKTHTILGDANNPGVLPRLLGDIFSARSQATTVKLSCLEIYNEMVYDLLRIDARKKIALKLQDCGGVVEAKGLSSHTINSAEHAMSLVKQGSANRNTAGTGLNDLSSRSHCVSTIEITDPLKETPTLLWIVDLAGSERMGRTGVASGGQRQKEANKINTSLMILWRCLNQMRRMQAIKATVDPQNTYFVPFRESKLTHLLMNHLSGSVSGYTMMIVNASPAAADYEETQHVLENSALAQEIVLAKNEERESKLFKQTKSSAQYDGNGRRVPKRRAEKSIEELKISSQTESVPLPLLEVLPGKVEKINTASNVQLTVNGNNAATAQSHVTPEIDVGSLEAENAALKKDIELLRETLLQQEAEIRMEVATEMAERMNEMQHQYKNSYLSNNAQQASVCASTRKLEANRLQAYIRELEDTQQECEEEIARMRQNYEEEIKALKGQIDSLKKELSAKQEAHFCPVLEKENLDITELVKENALLKEQLKYYNVTDNALCRESEVEHEVVRKDGSKRLKLCRKTEIITNSPSSINLVEGTFDKGVHTLCAFDGKSKRFPLAHWDENISKNQS